jgi:DNA-directed RNA polymerase specialized sigma24 family protein
MSYKEIAADLGWTLKNVEVKLYRIRKKVQKLLKCEGITL